MGLAKATGPADSEGERIRGAMQDPAVWVDDKANEQATYVVRRNVIEWIDRALAGASLRALLVKGAGLAGTVYPHPWQRPMDDIDLLIDPSDEARVLQVLESAGFLAEPVRPERRYSAALFGERKLSLQRGTVTWLIEVHHQLDKVVPRPIPYEELLARSRPLDGLASLRTPCREDHTLLVILHASSSEFLHPMAWIDLALLMEKDFNWTEFETRAHDWRLKTATFAALVTLQVLGFDAIPDGLVQRLRPSRTRSRLLRRYYRVGEYPVSTGPMRLGWTWMRRQIPLRDDTFRWLSGIAGYAARRAWEKTFRARSLRHRT